MAFTRRSILAGLISCPFCAVAATGAEDAKWDYEDLHNWGEHPTNEACAFGGEQSPVDLTGAIKARIRAPILSWKPQAFSIVNNGHTIQVNAAPGSFATSENGKFELKQIHFHAPSEHTIDGKHEAMEAHFVHAKEGGDLLVLGVLIRAGGTNKVFSAIMTAAPRTKGEASLKEPVNPTALLPRNRRFFRYEGSLTTPPCSEVVNWYVFSTPLSVAESDIEIFKSIFPMNARPPQPLRRRMLLTN